MKPLFILVVVMTSFSNLVDAQTTLTTIPVSAVSSFQKTFKDVDSVEWELAGDLVKAKFIYNERLAYAFFNEQGELLCIARSTSMQQIPPMLQLSFQNKFPEVTIRDAFEISGQTGTSYCLTIIKKGKKIILKSLGMEHWSVISKEKEHIKFDQ